MSLFDNINNYKEILFLFKKIIKYIERKNLSPLECIYINLKNNKKKGMASC